MTWLTGLLSLRNIAILAGLCLAAFAVQSMRIKHKNHKIDRLKTEIAILNESLDIVLAANQSNQTTIAELQQANQQCALNREANQIKAAQERTRHQGRIADITDKYEKLRKTKVVSDCANVRLDPAVIELLKD